MGTAIGREQVMEDVLEGDEGEPEVGRHRDVAHQLLETPLAAVRFAAPVTVRVDATVSKAAELMRARKASAVVVIDRNRTRKVVGIFTEHDLVERALPARGWASAPVSKYMTRTPETLHPEDSVAYALEKMSGGGFRHVPLVDREGHPAGVVTASDLLALLVEMCPEELRNLPPEPDLALHPRAEGE
jgi:CBS domain-containing protein